MGDVPYIKDFFELQEIAREPEEKDHEPLKDAEIICDHISFSYPNSDREALHDINLTIKTGEKVAIVGHNGSGKSTFVNLLCGLQFRLSFRISAVMRPLYGLILQLEIISGRLRMGK